MKTSLNTVAIRCATFGRIAVRTEKAQGRSFARQSLLSVLHRPSLGRISAHPALQAAYSQPGEYRLELPGSDMRDRRDWMSDQRTPGKPVTPVMNRQETLKAFAKA
jgi:hypothetical protein